ncbi:c-type cytochrome biogenesis protein CcmI, partial [Aquicoccus sp. SCR17]|nr:c-type cytochrome biogenesis protein CcmI [Carideicomes alvinocaridis]
MLFWALTVILALAVAAPLALVLLRGRRAGSARAEEGAAESDIAVYRDQLAEVERDRARGTIPEAEAARLRTEVTEV